MMRTIEPRLKGQSRGETRPTVHYIWWGNPATDAQARDATETPNRLAALGGANVHYWRNTADSMIGVQSTHGREYVLNPAGLWTMHAGLHDTIDVHEVKSTGNSVADEGGAAAADIFIDRAELSELPMHVRGTSLARGRLINAIIAAMSAYDMRSAVKDFLALLVLYRYGGWYFDTTTAITENTPGDFLDKLGRPHTAYSNDVAVEDEIKFVKTRVGGMITFMLDDRSDEYTKMLGQLPKNMPGIVEVDNIDTWCIYAPPRHPAVLIMIESYIERARNMGLDRYGLGDSTKASKTVQQQRNHRYLIHDVSAITQRYERGKKLEIVRSERNKIIGNINIASVQEGLAKYRASSGRSVRDTTLATRTATEAEKNVYGVSVVTCFGMGKRHAATWRKVWSFFPSRPFATHSDLHYGWLRSLRRLALFHLPRWVA